MKTGILVIFAFALVSPSVLHVQALECKYPVDYSRLVEEHDYVFVAQVHDIDPAENKNNEIVIFNLYLHVKGEIPGYIFEMEQEKHPLHRIDFEVGKAYNVFVNDGNPMYADSCATLPLEHSENYENYPHDIAQCGQGTVLLDGVCHAVDTELVVHRDCLIATASYGSELAPQVQMLREIRDNTLLNTESGKIFMDGFNSIYYAFSPTVAQWENEHTVFKESVKLFITPMIAVLSIMTMADDSETQVILYGLSSLGLIVGLYVVSPIVIVQKIVRRKRK